MPPAATAAVDEGVQPSFSPSLPLSLYFDHEEFCDELYVHRKTFAFVVFAVLGGLFERRVALLKEVGLHLKARRRKNSERPMPVWEKFLGNPVRQYIEAVFSRLTNLFSKKIHAVTPRGFELKIVCSLLAFSIQCL